MTHIINITSYRIYNIYTVIKDMMGIRLRKGVKYDDRQIEHTPRTQPTPYPHINDIILVINTLFLTNNLVIVWL